MNINTQRKIIIVKKKKEKKYAYDKKEIYNKMKSYIEKTNADKSYLEQLNKITNIKGYFDFFIKSFGKKSYHLYITRS